MSAGGSTSSRDESTCPSLTNVTPASFIAETRRRIDLLGFATPPALVEAQAVPGSDRDDLRVAASAIAAPKGLAHDRDRVAPRPRGPQELERQHDDDHDGEHPSGGERDEQHGDRVADHDLPVHEHIRLVE